MIKKVLIFICFFLTFLNFAWAATSDNKQNLSEKSAVQSDELQAFNKQFSQLNKRVSLLKDSLNKIDATFADQIENHKKGMGNIFTEIDGIKSLSADFQKTLDKLRACKIITWSLMSKLRELNNSIHHGIHLA